MDGKQEYKLQLQFRLWQTIFREIACSLSGSEAAQERVTEVGMFQCSHMPTLVITGDFTRIGSSETRNERSNPKMKVWHLNYVVLVSLMMSMHIISYSRLIFSGQLTCRHRTPEYLNPGPSPLDDTTAAGS